MPIARVRLRAHAPRCRYSAQFCVTAPLRGRQGSMICSKLRTQMACHCEMVKSGRADECRCQACNKRRKRRLKGSEKGARPAPRPRAPARAGAQPPAAAPAPARPRRRASMHPPKYSILSDEDEEDGGMAPDGALPAFSTLGAVDPPEMRPLKRRRQGGSTIVVRVSLAGGRRTPVPVQLARGEPFSEALHCIREALGLAVQPVRVFDGTTSAQLSAVEHLYQDMLLTVVPARHDAGGTGRSPMSGGSRLGSLVFAAASSRVASRDSSLPPAQPAPSAPRFISRGRSEEEFSAAEILQSLPRLGSSSIIDGPGVAPTLSAQHSSESTSGVGPSAADVADALGGTPVNAPPRPTLSRMPSQESLGSLGSFSFLDEGELEPKQEPAAGLGKHPLPVSSVTVGGTGAAPSLSPMASDPAPYSRDAGTGGDGLNKLPLQQVTLARMQSIGFLKPATQPGRA